MASGGTQRTYGARRCSRRRRGTAERRGGAEPGVTAVRLSCRRPPCSAPPYPDRDGPGGAWRGPCFSPAGIEAAPIAPCPRLSTPPVERALCPPKSRPLSHHISAPLSTRLLLLRSLLPAPNQRCGLFWPSPRSRGAECHPYPNMPFPLSPPPHSFPLPFSSYHLVPRPSLVGSTDDALSGAGHCSATVASRDSARRRGVNRAALAARRPFSERTVGLRPGVSRCRSTAAEGRRR